MKKINAIIFILILAALLPFAVFADSDLPNVPIGDKVYTHERKEATCTEDGYYITFLNGKEISRKIYPATGHSYIDGVCTACGAKKYIMGDVDGNGEVDANDVTLLSRYVAKWNGIVLNEGAADVDGNGEVDANDVTLLSRYVAKWNGIVLGK